MSTLGNNSLSAIRIGNPESGGQEVITACLGNTVVFENENYIPFAYNATKEICCLNWGTYKEIVTVDNGDDTVTITSTKVKKKNTSVLYRAILSVITRAKTSEDIIGTVKEPLGVTYTQAAAVKTLGEIRKTFPASSFYELYYFGITNTTNVFQSSTFSKAALPKGWTTVPKGCFADCANLTHIQLPSITSIGQDAFVRCSNLISLKIESVTPPTIGNRAFRDCGIYLHIAAPSRYPTPGYIYVPDESVDTYKTTGSTSSLNSWAYYRNYIRPISEYEN